MAVTTAPVATDPNLTIRPAFKWDLLVTLMGAPYSSDSISTVLRWVEVAATKGRVQVWTCGYSTLLTQRSLGTVKPANPTAWGVDYPTPALLIGRMLDRHPNNLRWLSCRFCGEERGATEHIDQVAVRPALAFGRHVGESAKTIFVGMI